MLVTLTVMTAIAPTERDRERLATRDADLPEEIFALFFDLFGYLRHHFADCAAEVGLGPGHAKALRLLEYPLSMRAMATALQCDASYITSLVDHLEERGLVERSADPHDRRVKLIHATSKGTRARKRFEELLFGQLPGTAGMTGAQLRTLRDGLSAMLERARVEEAAATR
jgi:DNA-binding MarR family transcriptional regulator